jgi:hypothetical protein
MIENFVQYAIKSYENPHVTTVEEFQKDVDKFSHINKLFHRYYVKNELNARLILNHVIILYNVFKTDACTQMIFYKTKPEYWSGIKTYLTYLNYMPEYVSSIDTKDSDIPIDNHIADELRKI